MAEKEDWPPLLTPGEHVLCLEELFILCVEYFHLSKERRVIFAGFRKIVRELDRMEIPADLVVDGSFLTEEIDPDDIDFAVVISQEYFDSCDGERLVYLEWIRDDRTIKDTHRCDCHLCIEFKADHPQYFDGIQNRSFWIGLFSKSIIYKRDRGVVIMPPEQHGTPWML
jgi:hypothetical protein